MQDEKCRKRRTSPCKFPFLCLPVVDKKGEPCCQKGWFGKDCPLPNIEKSEAECVYKPFFKIGLIWITLLRQFLFPASCATAVVYAKSKDEAHDVLKTRPSELPLYVDDPKPVQIANENQKMSTLEETIGCVRQELEILLSQGQVVKQQLDHIICTASAHTKGTINYLQEEENAIPRFGAIALGSTAGYILALRKGLFKRLLYATAGGLAMASLAYPQEAKEIADEAVAKAKKYFIIGYHLSNGVTNDLFGFQLPPLPVGHLNISDKHHPPPDAVPSSAHLLPPVATPSHIPLPHEDQHSYEIPKAPKGK